MLVILEGPDGSGKTHLARQLCERYELEYHHEGVPPADVHPLVHYGRLLDAARGGNVVFDRLALGERVYGPIVRGVDRLGADGWTVFSRLVAAVGARQVLCLPPVDVCHAAWAGRHGELLTDDSNFYRTYAEYGYHALRDWPSQRVYDHTVVSFEELTYDFGQPLDQLPRGVVGYPYATTLLVGDIVGDPLGLDLPFFATWGSSDYLTRALRAAGYCEWELAFVNAHTATGNVTELPRTNAAGVQWKQVIALGQRAARVCKNQPMPYRTVPHPQFVKRFHHHDISSYARELRGDREDHK